MSFALLWRCAAVLVAGTMVGNEIAVGFFVHPRLAALSDAVYAPARRTLARAFGAVMPFWYAATALLTGAAAWTLRGQLGFALAVLSFGVWVAVILGTVLFLAPLNARIAAWDVDKPPSGFRAQGARWDKMHVIRVGFLALALILLVAAVLSSMR